MPWRQIEDDILCDPVRAKRYDLGPGITRYMSPCEWCLLNKRAPPVSHHVAKYHHNELVYAPGEARRDCVPEVSHLGPRRNVRLRLCTSHQHDSGSTDTGSGRAAHYGLTVSQADIPQAFVRAILDTRGGRSATFDFSRAPAVPTRAY